MSQVSMPKVEYETIALKGGLDLVTPTLSKPPGTLIDAVNFECAVTGGYSRIEGYERVDGRPAPSAAVYQPLTLASFTNTPAVGDILTGQSSGATGVLAMLDGLVLIVTKVVGTFSLEAVNVGATPIGTIASFGGGATSELNAIYTNAAADIYRADITVVPGSGPVRGVALFMDVLYAFRDNAGATAGELYKSTSSGWSLVPFFNEVAFTAGTGSIVEGQTVIQGANTATIKRVVITAGDLFAGSAAGTLIVTTPAPGNFAAGAGTTSGGGTLTLSGAQTAITFAPGGHFEFLETNFTGASATRRLYGCDGANRGFEFDGTVLVPISTGSSPDTPIHLAALKNHMFWAIRASLIHSAPGQPYRYQAIDGAGEVAVGADITGLLLQRGSQTAGAMAVYVRNDTSLLYGTSASDWNLVSFGTGTGGLRYSVQNLFESFAFDDRGVMALSTSQNFGNFDATALTAAIQPFIDAKRTRVVASSVNRLKSQYRVFFNDTSGLYLTLLNGKYLGAMPISFVATPSCTAMGEFSNGTAASYFGATDGYVYQLDMGSSFDGEAIPASIVLTYATIRSPRLRKRYRKAAVEVAGSGFVSLSFGYSLGYGSDDIAQPGSVSYGSPLQAALWDSFTWDAFIWDGRTLAPTEAEMVGTAENVSITLGSATDYMQKYTVNSIIIHYSARRGLR